MKLLLYLASIFHAPNNARAPVSLVAHYAMLAQLLQEKMNQDNQKRIVNIRKN